MFSLFFPPLLFNFIITFTSFNINTHGVLSAFYSSEMVDTDFLVFHNHSVDFLRIASDHPISYTFKQGIFFVAYQAVFVSTLKCLFQQWLVHVMWVALLTTCGLVSIISVFRYSLGLCTDKIKTT